MLPSIGTLAPLLHEQQGTVSGYYTLAMLAQLAQNIGTLVFAEPEGVLVVGDSQSQYKWSDQVLRSADHSVQQIYLSNGAKTTDAAGLVICGLGRTHSFALAAIALDHVEDEHIQLFDTVWTCNAAAITPFVRRLDIALPAGAVERLAHAVYPSAETLLQLTGELLGFSARQHSTLAVANRALNERLRNQVDQTRMIVHDMRAPLHTLLISIKSLRRQKFDLDGQHELLDVANDSAAYLLNLTETVLDSARLETSTWLLKLQPLRIATLVRAVCEPLELAARSDQAHISHAVDENLPTVHGDRSLLERVLTNLVTNAIKYTPKSGSITITARPVNNNLTVELVVRDTGQGIESEAQKHIFERFYQVRDSDRSQGTGLGLYFCRLAIEAHGGSIDVESTPGQGSAFVVLLPISPPNDAKV